MVKKKKDRSPKIYLSHHIQDMYCSHLNQSKIKNQQPKGRGMSKNWVGFSPGQDFINIF
jgi:hypothetical protein